MKYTRYLSANVQAHGVPQIEAKAFGTIMNIVHLEGKILGLREMQQREPIESEKYKYNIWITENEEKIDSLTQGLEPGKLMEKLIS